MNNETEKSVLQMYAEMIGTNLPNELVNIELTQKEFEEKGYYSIGYKKIFVTKGVNQNGRNKSR